MKIVNVVGARPNFMKIAPLMAEYRRQGGIEPVLVHTGQHYDEQMSDLFFRQLEIPEPDVNLGVGSASHAVQTAEIMKAFEPVCLQYKPDAVLVVGDVNSTIACGLTAVKLGIKLIHVEAGLRSGDRSMPEEVNRILTDAISDLLFCTEQSGVDNLLASGVEKEKIHLVGHVMIDTLVKNIEKARQSSNILEELKLRFGLGMDSFAVLTLHRPANVDDTAVFKRIVAALEVISGDMPVVFPVHPRTRKNIAGTVIGERLEKNKNICMVEPLGYFDFLKLMSSAVIVLTDSGGIQEETTVLKIPCITLRDNTERPVTAEIGSNQVAGTKTEAILAAYRNVMDGKWREPKIPPLWDGRAAERIVAVLKKS
jgi:UDP-N-acetylglucosamine 2-epimerase (non-hydrolysing)